MTVITVPSGVGFEECTITLERATQQLRSPFTGKRQVVVSSYALWQFEGNVVPAQGVDAGQIRSFLTKLKGRANTFRLPIPAADVPISGYAGLQGKVNGVGLTGSSIPTDGWSPSTTIFRDGDYFNIGDELKMATQDIASNGSGVATLFFEPPLRTSPADNTDIKFSNPFIYLAASEDDIAKWKVKDYNTHLTFIKATEAYE